MSTGPMHASAKHHRSLAYGGAFLLAATLFSLVPLTQYIGKEATNTIEFRKTVLVQPALPVAPPKAEPPPEKEPPKPKFQQQFNQLNLSQLQLSLKPSIQDALAVGIASGGFDTEIDTVEDIQEMFTFADLPEAPRIINQPRIQFPQTLIQQGVREGRVIVLIEINERGRATVISIKSSTHPQLVKAARNVIRQAQFTKPLIDGVPQQVSGEWPIVLRAPK